MRLAMGVMEVDYFDALTPLFEQLGCRVGGVYGETIVVSTPTRQGAAANFAPACVLPKPTRWALARALHCPIARRESNLRILALRRPSGRSSPSPRVAAASRRCVALLG